MNKSLVIVLIAILVLSTVSFAGYPDPSARLVSKKYSRLAGNAVFTGAQIVVTQPNPPQPSTTPSTTLRRDRPCPLQPCAAPPAGCTVKPKLVNGCPTCGEVVCEQVSAESNALGVSAVKSAESALAFAKEVLPYVKDDAVKKNLEIAMVGVDNGINAVNNFKDGDLAYLNVVRNLVGMTKNLNAVSDAGVKSVEGTVSDAEKKKAEDLRKKKAQSAHEQAEVARARESLTKDLASLEKETAETQSRWTGIRDRLNAILSFFGLT